MNSHCIFNEIQSLIGSRSGWLLIWRNHPWGLWICAQLYEVWWRCCLHSHACWFCQAVLLAHCKFLYFLFTTMCVLVFLIMNFFYPNCSFFRTFTLQWEKLKLLREWKAFLLSLILLSEFRLTVWCHIVSYQAVLNSMNFRFRIFILYFFPIFYISESPHLWSNLHYAF